MEAELVPKHGYEMAYVHFSGLRGKGLLRKLALPFNLLIALWQSAKVLIHHRPDVVLGMGGYITFPGGVMAKLLGYPLVIHEQNSIAGLSNRALSWFATRVLSGFPDVLPKAQWCGNPVRSAITTLPEPAVRYAARTGKLNVLVVGGSLGAQALNQAIPAALALLPSESRPNVIHQTGKNHYVNVQTLYQRAGVSANIRPFLDDMAGCYTNADLVICRAGALTVAELAAVGVASVLIPFPFAVDDHQTHNALFLSEQNAAIHLPQSALNAEKIAHYLSELSRTELGEMAQKARSLAKSDAAQTVAEICASYAKKP
jgi:UDP-N-acetylglucosamine--N-acetylmuramyl-(pentapeptide) pyrophosphoryl-undecaprenol N-acetylglucosamine transferase